MTFTVNLSEQHVFWAAMIAGPIIYLLVGSAFTGLLVRWSPRFRDFMRGGPLPLIPFIWPLVLLAIILCYVFVSAAVPFVSVYNLFTGGKTLNS